MVSKSRRDRSTSGQSLVEFALAIPFVLLCVIAIIYFGKAFLVAQTLSYAAQEGARVAARTPNLNDAAIRERVRGFTTGGGGVNPDSVVYAALAGARLLSGGTSGDLPPGSTVKVLPWDTDGSPEDVVPPGTVAVRITYPYSLLINPFTGQAAGETTQVAIQLSAEDNAAPVPFPDFAMSEKATAAQEIYQEVN
jgi:hypothetical protein